MSSSDHIEQAAATIDEAIRQALDLLGAEEDDVTIEILTTPRSGVLGLGSRQARVRVTRRSPTAAREAPTPSPALTQPSRPRPAAEGAQSTSQSQVPRPSRRGDRATSDRESRREVQPLAEGQTGAAAADSRPNVDRVAQTREAIDVLGRVLELMGEKCEVVPGPDRDPESLELEIRGDGSGILIGRHGQTLDALEYIVNRALARRLKDAINVTLDTEAYRARRRQQIHRMALSMGERAKREHAAVKLDPMAPRERRIVHLALKDDPLITTRSSGEGYIRAIEIVPVGPAARKQPASPQRERGREGAVGEQGGFKHGQKKII
jgi:spoIIIJ-associated protein